MPVITFTLNGHPVSVDADHEEELLWVLNDRLGVKGPKYGCGMGLCGACTSHVDGIARRTCITTVGSVADHQVTTIEGIAQDGWLHPVQQAWIDTDVAQCGYCQAGQIMQAISLLRQNPHPTDDDINEAMAGNLCRCGTYFRIRSAIKRVAAGNYNAPRRVPPDSPDSPWGTASPST
jgi:isoquinoline 1-oxidoreductase alpha subunit